MSTVKSSSEDLTLNADGSGNDVVIQSNGTTTATVTATGVNVTGTITADGIVDVLGGTIELNGNEINGVKVTIADDAFSTITPTGRYGGYLSISAQTNGAFPQHQYSAFLFSDFGSSPSSSAVNTGINFNTSTAGAPTGTTGTDGKVTLFLGGTSGTYYLENRLGSSHTFHITLI